MAALHPINFFVSSLRAPCLVSDTQLQLATGSTAPLGVIASGDFVYLTVNDGTTVEVMKYISSGAIVGDTITVIRAQDNTTAKAFPTGACVAIGWNVLQIDTLITQFISGGATFPPNTQVITGTSTVPSGAPADNVIYTVNTTTGQSWYWNGTSWIALSSNNIQLLTVAPSTPPTGGFLWAFNLLTASLYFWDGARWDLVSGNPGYLEAYNRQYLDPDVGVVLSKGVDNVFSTMITDATITVTPTYYKANPLPVGILSVTAGNTIKFSLAANVILNACIQGTVDDTKDVKGILAIFHTGDVIECTNETFHPANTGTAFGISVGTGLFQVAANDEVDVNLVLVDGGGSYDGLTLNQFTFNVAVISLI